MVACAPQTTPGEPSGNYAVGERIDNGKNHVWIFVRGGASLEAAFEACKHMGDGVVAHHCCAGITKHTFIPKCVISLFVGAVLQVYKG